MRIAVIGVGLIGGSIGARGARAARRERRRATTAPARVAGAALDRGAVDRCARASSSDAVADAEAVFVAVPVGALPGVVGEVLAAAPARLRRQRRRLDQARGRRRRSTTAASSAATRWRAPRPPASSTRAPTCSRRDLVPDADRRRPRACCTSASTACSHGLGRAAGGDRRRDARHDPRDRLAPPARARERARGAGRAGAGRRGRARCRPPGRASATRPAWRARRARCGPTSTCRNRDALGDADRARRSSGLRAVRRRAATPPTPARDHRVERRGRGRPPPAARGRARRRRRCSSCACRCRTGRA